MKSEGKPNASVAKAETAMRRAALAYPETKEDFPWGESAIKVKGKTFLFMRADAGGLGLSVKLPASGVSALLLPFAEPTHYGLGKSGWVSASFGPGDAIPLEMLLEWLDESYRAVAPKRVADSVPRPGVAASTPPPRAAAPRSPKPKPAAPRKKAAVKARRPAR